MTTHAGRVEKRSLILRCACECALAWLVMAGWGWAQTGHGHESPEETQEPVSSVSLLSEGREQEPAPPADQNVQTAPGTTATLHGVVVNAATGEPVPRVLVRLTSGRALGALTDGDGRFAISGVPTGVQTFDVQKPGFGGTVAMTDFLVPTSHTVRVAAEMADVRFPLAPLNALDGQVTLSTGDPAVSVGVTLLRQTVQAGRASWSEVDRRQSTPDGRFRFSGLDDGVYLLMSRPVFDNGPADAPSCSGQSPTEVSGYPVTFYGGTADIGGAARLVLRGGQTGHANMTLTTAQFHEVQVTPTRAPVGGPWQFSGALEDPDGVQLEYPLRQDEKTHVFCAYLPDGNYVLTATATMNGVAERFVRSMVREANRNRTLTGMLNLSMEGHAELRLRVPLGSGTGTPVHIHYEPAAPAPTSGNAGVEGQGEGDPVTLAAVRVNGLGAKGDGGIVMSTEGSEDAELGMLSPGRYWIGAATSRRGTCLGAATTGGQSLAHTPWVAGPSGAGEGIEVVVRTDCAKLTLQLTGGLAGEMPGEDRTLFYSVIPAFDFVGDLREGVLQATGDRTARLEDLTPGTYRIYTFTTPHVIEFQNPEALERLGGPSQEVTLEPNGSANVVLEAPTQ
ncbi:MAG TPA: carboxypeptidase-like regulatory domain-containing protein [Terracidiphilus sp.]|nr:carboxypeptidase-like regulatory domain-containing protein [Terracidiphilus sp.]